MAITVELIVVNNVISNRKEDINMAKELIRCYRCDKVFPKNPKGIMAYRLHKEDHRVDKENDVVAKKPDMILDIHKDDLKPKATTPPPVEEKPLKSPTVMPTSEPKTPIKLTYRYIGQCLCGAEVDTLEVDVDKYIVIAYCQSCHKQLVHRPVEKL